MHTVILGNGIAGITTARTLRRLRPDWPITLVSGESDYFFSRTALMYVYMGHLRFADTKPYPDAEWEALRIRRVRAWVTCVDTAARRLLLERGNPLPYDQLLLATGSQPNRLGWPGQDLAGVQGLYSLDDLARLEAHTPGTRRAAIVGGGLIGVELAEMLHSRGIHVTMLVREGGYWGNALPPEESRLVGGVIGRAGIELRLHTELAAIEDDGRGRAGAVLTSHGERLPCQLVGLTVGVRPNLSALAGADLPIGRGVLVDATLRTRIDGVFAAGDCAELPTGVEQLWYTGRMQGEVVGHNLARLDEPPRTYDRGLWFNSAKFFDLEWQTYGFVPGGTGPRAPDERHHWWQRGDAGPALRIVTRAGAVTGMNVLGLRQRQNVWTRWIAERRPLEHVLKHLREAAFDPELFRRCEREIAGGLREVE